MDIRRYRVGFGLLLSLTALNGGCIKREYLARIAEALPRIQQGIYQGCEAVGCECPTDE